MRAREGRVARGRFDMSLRLRQSNALSRNMSRWMVDHRLAS
jgi:hypothetical protein